MILLNDTYLISVPKLYFAYLSSHQIPKLKVDSDRSGKYTRARVLYQQLKAGLCQPHGRRIHANRVFHYIFAIFFKNGWKQRLFKSVETFRDYTTEKSKHLLLLPFLSKVIPYVLKSHLNRVISYLSLSMKTSVVLYFFCERLLKSSIFELQNCNIHQKKENSDCQLFHYCQNIVGYAVTLCKL